MPETTTSGPATSGPELAAAPGSGRRRGRRAVLVAGGLVAAVLTVFAGLGVLQGTTGTERRVETRAFPASVTRLVVDGDAGGMTLYGPGVTPAPGIAFPTTGTHGIGLVVKLSGFARTPTLTARVEGDTVRVSTTCRLLLSCSAAYYLRVPAGVRVDLHAVAGTVTATGVAGSMRLRSEAAAVRIERPRGDLDVVSTGGEVRIVDSRARQVRASTSAGDVYLDATVAPDGVDLRSAAGSVQVLLPLDAPPYAVDVHTRAGDRNVSIDRDTYATRHLRATSAAGDVTVGYRDGS